jgi:hypothetical protein
MRSKFAGMLLVLTSCVASFSPMDDTPADAGAPDAQLPSQGRDASTPRPDAAVPREERDAGSMAAPDASMPVADAGAFVDVFVGAGKMGRRTISCDDGLTWKNNVSVDDNTRCFTSPATDCDHNASSSTALIFANGFFLHSMGWGKPGTVFRSPDGVTFSKVNEGKNLQDLMFGNGRIIAATRNPVHSDDFGATWTNSAEIKLEDNGATIYNVRGGTFGGTGSGAFVVTSQDGENFDIQYSLDNGETWKKGKMADGSSIDNCGAGHVVAGAGRFVLLNQQGDQACVSADNGATWSAHSLPNANITSNLLWTGEEFMAWSQTKRYQSVDGVMWSSTTTSTRRAGRVESGPTLGPVARSASGTFVSVRGGWQNWYDKQRFYRSLDGVTWDELPDNAYIKSHPMTAIVHARIEAGAACR